MPAVHWLDIDVAVGTCNRRAKVICGRRVLVWNAYAEQEFTTEAVSKILAHTGIANRAVHYYHTRAGIVEN